MRWSPWTRTRQWLGMASIAALAVVALPAAPVAAYGPIFECPAPTTITMATLLALNDGQGPLSTRTGTLVNERALACLGSNELEFVAFVARPEGLGGVTTYTIEPRWLDTWSLGSDWLALTNHATPGFFDGPFMQVAVPPGLQPAFASLDRRWVTVRGHFGDPLAETCRFGTDPAPESNQIPAAADLVQMCRTSLVLSAIAAIDSPCPRPTIDWAAIASTPEHLRADCFGDERLTFVARGLTVFTAWPLFLPPVNDWALLDPVVGAQDSDIANALGVFVPDDVKLPDPAGTPWHDRDGVGGTDVWWQVTGHFADPRSAACRANPEGYTVDGRLFVWSDEDAAGLCRNRLFVDELEWLPDGPPLPDAITPTPSASPAASATAVPSAPSSRSPGPTAVQASPSAPVDAPGVVPAVLVAILVGVVAIVVGLLVSNVMRQARRR